MNTPLTLLYFHIIFLSIFCVGFFSYDNASNNQVQLKQAIRKHRKTSKLVFLIVDAFRVDFVSTGHAPSHMPFLQSSILNNRSCYLNIKVNAPTVTMPRIKALTSGTIPNFMDIVLNLGSPEFRKDTFVHQAINAGLKVVFYGDDTWLKMFPNAFVRSGGTHSFLATDYWDVDKNITTNVKEELKRTDWDIMVIHYLGLDHIGHIEGPRSKLIPRKLKEMDNIVNEISDALKSNHLGTKFLVTGDHGMKDSGGHGGVSSAEVNVPLVLVGDPCRALKGWPDVSSSSYDQIDIAATVAIALGLPIPAESIGKFIPELLTDFSDHEILDELKNVKEQLLMKSGIDFGDLSGFSFARTYNSTTPIEAFVHDEVSKYSLELTILTEELRRNVAEYDLNLMLFGCISLWICLITYLPSCAWPKNFIHLFLILGSAGYSLSLASSSFIEEEHQTWYYLWATFLILTFRDQLKSRIGKSLVTLWPFLILCIQHRILRKLNQTGDKWAHLPDWRNYLLDSPVLHFFTFFSGTILLYKYFSLGNSSILSRILFGCCLLATAAHNAALEMFGHIKFLQVTYPKSRGTTEALMFYFILICFVIYNSYRRNVALHWFWCLLTALTLRPHNVILIPMHIFISRCIYKILPSKQDAFWNTLIHIWTGYIFYFYQGNSNSLASIDVAPAFIGVNEFHPLYGSLMTIVHTYAAPVLALALSPKHPGPATLLRLLPVTFYTTIVILQRHHLFVWSVFSPKLLFELALSVVFCLFYGCYAMLTIVHKKTGCNKDTLK